MSRHHSSALRAGGLPGRTGVSVLPRSVVLLLATAAAAGCTSTSQVIGREVITEGIEQGTPVRSAANLPVSFEIISPATVSSDCPPLLRDPGVNVTLSLRASVLQPIRQQAGTVSYGAIGDYAAEPRGRYGEVQGEGLRIDCTRMWPLGIVRIDSE